MPVNLFFFLKKWGDISNAVPPRLKSGGTRPPPPPPVPHRSTPVPKAVLYGELAKGKRLRGGQRLRYKDVVKRHLKATHITVDHWEILAQDRQQWRQAIHKGKSHIEEKISQKYQHDHNIRHGFPDASARVIFCVNCGRGFTAQI